jgi:hypothetical protein
MPISPTLQVDASFKEKSMSVCVKRVVSSLGQSHHARSCSPFVVPSSLIVVSS